MAYQPIPGPSSGSSSSSGFQFLNSPFGDTTYTKVFVGGLAWETQSETMRRYFEQFGEILEAVVITDKNTGRSKGYGFVSIYWFQSCLSSNSTVFIWTMINLLHSNVISMIFHVIPIFRISDQLLKFSCYSFAFDQS